MKRYLLKFWIYLLLAILFITAGLVYWILKIKNPKVVTAKPTTKTTQETPKTTEKELVAKVVPVSAEVAVPYTVQAPFAKWNIHEESCEEAAILMYHYFFINKALSDIPPQTADAELIKLKSWQTANWGPEKDLNLTELGSLANKYYGYKPEVKENITAETIKAAISEGKPVLVPVMTHALKNPHYNVNDSYHILLIKGYDATGVTTNDAGIREGKNWHYSWEILWQAIDAQTPKMNQGRSLLLLKQ